MTLCIAWFTLDLRLHDNPMLTAAAHTGRVLPLYVLDDSDPWAPGGASRWWLHHSLAHLAQAIEAQGGHLVLKRGDILPTLLQVLEDSGAEEMVFSRAHEPWLAERQQQLHRILSERGVRCRRFGGRLLLEPDRILNKQGKPFQVFTPYYRHCLSLLPQIPPASQVPPRAPSGALTEDSSIDWAPVRMGDALTDWALRPTQPDWAQGFAPLWKPGSDGARQGMQQSLDEVVADYATQRDCPAQPGTSRLSPHLHFGELSPRALWQATLSAPLRADQREPFLRQLIWREFSHYLLHHWPQLPEAPFKPAFGQFPWQTDNLTALRAWQTGTTGYPLVDAGMRELWQTGWMHNRVRMITASFLTKHLRHHWRDGARWFWDTLVDADLANNSAGWQWVAGCGADAAPYFRIFNPVRQGETFDPDGDYIRRWVPELAGLPARHIHQPWQAPDKVLAQAGVRLGDNYPLPLVAHDQARSAALAAYASIKAASDTDAPDGKQAP